MKKLLVAVLVGMMVIGFGSVAMADKWVGVGIETNEGIKDDFQSVEFGIGNDNAILTVGLSGIIPHGDSKNDGVKYYMAKAKAELVYSIHIAKNIEVFTGSGLNRFYSGAYTTNQHVFTTQNYITQVFGASLDLEKAKLTGKCTLTKNNLKSYSLMLGLKF